MCRPFCHKHVGLRRRHGVTMNCKMDLPKLKTVCPWSLQFLSEDGLDDKELEELKEILAVKNSSVQLPWDFSYYKAEDLSYGEKDILDGEVSSAVKLPKEIGVSVPLQPSLNSAVCMSPVSPLSPDVSTDHLARPQPYSITSSYAQFPLPLNVLHHGSPDVPPLPQHLESMGDIKSFESNNFSSSDVTLPPESVPNLKVDKISETPVKSRVLSNKQYPRRNKKKVPKTDYYDTPEENQSDCYKQTADVSVNHLSETCDANQDNIPDEVTSLSSPLMPLPVGPSYPRGIPTLFYFPVYSYPGYLPQVPTPVIATCERESDGGHLNENSDKVAITVRNQTAINDSVHSEQGCSNFSSQTITCTTPGISISESQILDDRCVYSNEKLPSLLSCSQSQINNGIGNKLETGLPTCSGGDIKENSLLQNSHPDDSAELSPPSHSNGSCQLSEPFRTSNEWCNMPSETEECNNSQPVINTFPSTHRSWADLFKKNACSNSGVENSVPPASVPLAASVAMRTGCENDNIQETSSKENEFAAVVSPEEDELTPELGRVFQEIKVNHTPTSQQPRGLINKRNWCYINAILQVLLACPPFYNLLRQIPLGPAVKRGKSSTPILDSLVKFSYEFPPVPVVKNKKKDDLKTGAPFEPVYIYQMLRAIKSECVKGQQEDAEEFLSCILNGLHDEIVALIKAVQKNSNYALGNGEVSANGNLEDSGDEDAWHVMGPKNKSILTRSTSIFDSPISTIFGGQIKSVLTTGAGTSASIQPFFTLQLDIQSEKVDSVLEALSQMTAKEPLQGYTCCKTKQEVEAFNRMWLEKLPPVLILHFKRFVYKKDGGCKKVMKKTDYPIELELGKDLLSPELKKIKLLHTYTLFAVVYHHGEEAVKGHYIADIFHLGSDSWLRCDDRNITQISEDQVLRHNPPCVPYLLFYRSSDTTEQMNCN